MKYFYFLIGAFTLLVSFNNCGGGFVAENSSGLGMSALFSRSPGESCDDGLMRVFKGTYQPFLAQSCSECHTNGPGIGTFADTNTLRAYDSFMSIGPMKISYQALNDSHKPPYTGAHNAEIIDTIKGAWMSAEAEYVSCKTEDGDFPVGVVKTTNKTIPDNLNANTYAKLTWDLQLESNAKLPLVATIEVRLAQLSGVVRGYEFRNPTLRLKDAASGNYNVRGINFYIDNHFHSEITTYTGVDSVISGIAEVNVAPGSANALAVYTPALGTQIALEFPTLESTTDTGATPTPTPVGPGVPVQRVTFATLIGPGGIFATNCIGCHGGDNPKAGLRITDYNLVKNAAATIKARVNNPANPMPQGGLLPAAQRDIISAWVDAGAPQN